MCCNNTVLPSYPHPPPKEKSSSELQLGCFVQLILLLQNHGEVTAIKPAER
jgi:hypothetical protein